MAPQVYNDLQTGLRKQVIRLTDYPRRHLYQRESGAAFRLSRISTQVNTAY
jgi:hypothetical protein